MQFVFWRRFPDVVETSFLSPAFASLRTLCPATVLQALTQSPQAIHFERSITIEFVEKSGDGEAFANERRCD